MKDIDKIFADVAWWGYDKASGKNLHTDEEMNKKAKSQLIALMRSLVPEKGSVNFGGTNPWGVAYKSDRDAVQHGYNQAIEQILNAIEGLEK